MKRKAMNKKTIFIAVLVFWFFHMAAADAVRLKSWIVEGDVENYQQDNLWELIDGAAETFLSYGFAELRAFECSMGTLRFMVHIYDMGSPLSAFGMYRSENPPVADSVRIGAEAQFSDYLAVMLTGRYYVKVETIKDKTVFENCGSLFEELVAFLGDEDGFPAELSLLPRKDMVPLSESYVHESFLGVTELHHVLFARYQSGETAYRRFVITGCDAGEFMKALPPTWKRSILENGLEVRIREIPYIGPAGLVIRNGKAYGVADVRDEVKARKILESWTGKNDGLYDLKKDIKELK